MPKWQVEHLIALCEGRWERSKVSKGNASELHGLNTGSAEHPLGQEGYGDTRTSSSVHLQWDETIVTERIAARVAAVTQTKLAQARRTQNASHRHDMALRRSYNIIFIYNRIISSIIFSYRSMWARGRSSHW